MLKLAVAIFGVVPVLGCGSDVRTFDNPVDTGQPVPAKAIGGLSKNRSAFVVTTQNDLPACNNENNKALVYVKAESSFKTCQNGTWETIDLRGPAGVPGVAGAPGATGAAGSPGATGATGAIGTAGPAGTPGISVASRWKFHVDSTIGEPDVETETTGFSYLTDVSLIKFSDSSVFVGVNVFSIFTSETGPASTGTANTHETNYPSSYSFFAPSAASEQEFIFKFNSYADMRIGFKVKTSVTPPTFKTVIDADGNFSNNTYRAFTLSPE